MASNPYEFKITDNSAIVKKAMEKAEEAILEAIGIQVQSHTVANITEVGRVDTGLMRNSIAYAVSGKQPSLGDYDSSGKQKRTYRSNSTHAKTGQPVTRIQKGTYTGHAPSDKEGHKAVYVGSNVSYFAYNELGFRLPSGRHVPPMNALKNAVAQVQREVPEIAKQILRNAPE